MPDRAPGATELRVLVVAPIGRDAQVTGALLREAGMESHACASLAELAAEVRAGAGAILITTEALGTEGAPALSEALAAQEPWSNVPIVFAAEHGNARELAHPIERLRRAGAVTVLERPIRAVTLRTVLQTALQSRLRQYELRDVLEELRGHVERLDAERVVRERFVSLLAHDLRGPLSVAMTSARLLAVAAGGAGPRLEQARRIERSMTRMDRMIRDLLDANRIRAGERLPADLEPCDLVAIVREALADLDEPARARVTVHGPDRLEGVWAHDQLLRATWNLLTNALKYGAPGAPVDVTLARVGETATLAVRNDGPAISPGDVTRIFEPFGRARGAEERARGWGLGLTLVRGCAEAHGGALSVESSAERGTTFTLRLPLDARGARSG